MGLREYKKKRNFLKTAEPKGGAVKKNSNGMFVIQKHAASHLHYDFRLEIDGVLKSWAVPKGPSLDPSVKRLAMHVEDHPIEYGSFEGTIPKGQYGGGSVLLWDNGSWIPEEDPRKGYKEGHLKFTLKGQKLSGRWALIRFGKTAGKGKETWLLRKEKDRFASKKDILRLRPESIQSGLLIDEIDKKDKNIDEVDQKKATRRGQKPKKKGRSKPLQRYAFQLATLATAPPQGPDWVYEIKLDGYRIQAYIADGTVTLRTRNGNDYTAKFPKLVSVLEKVPGTAVLDGEVTIHDEEGRTNFQLLQNALSEEDTSDAVYYAFDLLHLNGEEIHELPLEERKEKLEALCKTIKSPLCIYSRHLTGRGDDILKHACELGVEGLIAKKLSSTYHGRRTKDWIKAKCIKRQEFVIAGFTPSTNKTFGFGALLLGVHDEKKGLVYAGKVGTGFTIRSRRELRDKLKKLVAPQSPFDQPVPSGERKGVIWVSPQLVGEVAFTEWTQDGRCRHPSFQGLREDKSPSNITKEKEITVRNEKATKTSAKTKRSSKKAKDPEVVGGVTLTNPDRPIYPGTQVTKKILAQFFWDAQKWILPRYLNRPLVLVRCPHGGKKCFFQKHATDSIPDDIPRLKIKEEAGGSAVDYISVRSIKHLIQLIQLNVVEFHSWGSKANDVEHPDEIVFDFDPSPEVPWAKVVAAASGLRKFLAKYSLDSFAKTTGGKGLHVIVPIAPKYSWETVKELSHKVATEFSAQYPGEFTTNMSKAKRKGKIFIDYLRNGRGATSILPYSPRARANTPLAVPISWKELSKQGTEYSLEAVKARLLSSFRDPWASIEKKKQSLHRLESAIKKNYPETKKG